MSAALKCDKCEVFYDPYLPGKFTEMVPATYSTSGRIAEERLLEIAVLRYDEDLDYCRKCLAEAFEEAFEVKE